MPDVEAMLTAFRADLAAVGDLSALDDVRRAHAGKASPLKGALKGLKTLSAEDKPVFAAVVNAAIEHLAESVTEVERGPTEVRLEDLSDVHA